MAVAKAAACADALLEVQAVLAEALEIEAADSVNVASMALRTRERLQDAGCACAIGELAGPRGICGPDSKA